MRLTAETSVTFRGKTITAYAGPSSWADVQAGVYFNATDLAKILGIGLAPAIKAEAPNGARKSVCSAWVALQTLSQKKRPDELRELILATRQADEAFGNAPEGYRWKPI